MAWLWLLLLGAALGLISLPYQALSSLGLALQQHLWLNSESVSAVAVALVFASSLASDEANTSATATAETLSLLSQRCCCRASPRLERA